MCQLCSITRRIQTLKQAQPTSLDRSSLTDWMKREGSQEQPSARSNGSDRTERSTERSTNNTAQIETWNQQ